MDDKLFKQKLSEVSEWKLPDTPRETSLNAKKKRGRKSAEDEYMELREEIFHEEFGGVNPTYAPMLLKVKHTAKTCEDCGEICRNGRHKESKVYENKGRKYWKEHCLTCDQHKDPFTGEYCLTGTEASIKWTNFCREVKGVYKTQGNLQRDVEIIRSYPDTLKPI